MADLMGLLKQFLGTDKRIDVQPISRYSPEGGTDPRFPEPPEPPMTALERAQRYAEARNRGAAPTPTPGIGSLLGRPSPTPTQTPKEASRWDSLDENQRKAFLRLYQSLYGGEKPGSLSNEQLMAITNEKDTPMDPALIDALNVVRPRR